MTAPFEVSGPRVMACPRSSMTPRHYLGPYSQPCRCYEIENALKANEPQHCAIVDLEIRPRYLRVFDKNRIFDTHDVLKMDFEELSTLRGMDQTGRVALIYKMAHRGIEIPAVTAMKPTSVQRMAWQLVWEGTRL